MPGSRSGAGRAAAVAGARRPHGAGRRRSRSRPTAACWLPRPGTTRAAVAARRWSAAGHRGPSAERQRRRLHAGRPRAGDRRLRRHPAHLAARRRRARCHHAADAAQHGGGRARRRDRRRRRRRQGLLPVRRRRGARRDRSGPTPIIAVAVSATARWLPPPASAARSPSSSATRRSRARWSDRACRSGRRRSSRQPHADHRRHRPHGAALGCGQRRADRHRGDGRARGSAGHFAGDPGAEVFAPASPATRSRPTRAIAPARRSPASSAAGSRRCPATISPRRSRSSTSCGRRRRSPGCSRSGRWPTRPAPRCRSRGIGSAEDRAALVKFLEKATK